MISTETPLGISGGTTESNVERRILAPKSKITDSADPDDSLFISRERKSSFFSIYRHRKIVNGKRVVLSDIEGLDITSKIEAMGWTPMITMAVPIYPRLVKLFYCNLQFNRDEPSITSLVNGTPIRLDCRSLAAILGIPNEGVQYYKIGTWEVEDCRTVDAIRIVCEDDRISSSISPSHWALPPQNRLLHHMLGFIFLPRGRPREAVSKMELFLLKKIVCGERVNLCYIIIHQMIDSILCKTAGSHLPYGMLLTKVFNACNVVIGPEEECENLMQKDIYNFASVSRICRRNVNRGSKKRKMNHDEEEQESEKEARDEEEEEKPAVMDETLRDLFIDEPKRSGHACVTDSSDQSVSKLTARMDSLAFSVGQLDGQHLETMGPIVDKTPRDISIDGPKSSWETDSSTDQSLNKLNDRVDSLAASVDRLYLQQEQGFANLNSRLDILMDFLNNHFSPYPPPPTPFGG